MSNRLFAAPLIVAVLGLGSWALAQQIQTGGATNTAVGPVAAPATGRYAVSSAGNTAVLLETTTGKTWRLQQQGGHVFWIPIPRFETTTEAEHWLRTDHQKQIEMMRKRVEAPKLDELKKEEPKK